MSQKLRMDDLVVESFSTSDAESGRGTVEAQSPPTMDAGCGGEGTGQGQGWTCEYTCNIGRWPKCENEFTKEPTCPNTCSTCVP